MKTITKKITWLTIFSIAMGFMEAAIVIYLRKIYYPDGFNFPLAPIDSQIAFIEFFREAATIIMLAGIGIIAGKNSSQRFAFFIYCFAIWDIFYYVFLKVLIDWPQSIFTWDILFLIPVPWVGPVLAPCIVSLSLIIFMLSIIHFQEKNEQIKIKLGEWIFLITGFVIIIISFVWDYFKTVIISKSTNSIWTLTSKDSMFSEIEKYIPNNYNWWLFSAGQLMVFFAIAVFIMREKNE